MKTKLMTLFAALLLCAGTNAQSVATNGRTTKTLVAYFSRYVQQHLGMKPTDYRE